MNHTVSAPRIGSLDLARGIAITLMLLSHGVKSLLYFREMPPWGIVPVHLLTKFGSTLFILIFGICIGLFYIPRLDDGQWVKHRDRLWWRALVLLFWYKVLTVIQLAGRVRIEDLKSTLLFRLFPDFVEILSFYAFSLIWIAVFIRLWRRFPVWAKVILVPLPAGIGQYLQQTSDFLGIWPLKAILVEDPRVFCFGVLTRASLVLLGVLIGETYLNAQESSRRWRQLSMLLVSTGGVLLSAFFAICHRDEPWLLRQLARNVGKHPPSIDFMLFSLGGALVLLGVALYSQQHGRVFRPLVAMGHEALVVFIAHIAIIFLVYRHAFALRGRLSYLHTLVLTGALFLACWMVAELWTRSRSLRLHRWHSPTPCPRPGFPGAKQHQYSDSHPPQ